MTGLRRAALVALLAGQVGAWAAGVLPAPLLLLAVLVTVGSAAVARRLPQAAVRTTASVLALLLALLALPQVDGGGGEAGLRGVLGPLLVGISAVQPLTWARRRDLQTAVLVALGLLVLGASFAPDVLVGIPLLVGWGAALVAIALATAARSAETADVVLAGPRTGSAPAAAALAGALGLVLFLLLPLPEDAGLSSRLAGAASAAGAGSGRGAPGAYTGERVDLRVRGELSDRPLLRVPADSPPLWRSGVYTTWDGTGWTRPDGRRRVTDGQVAAASGPVRTDRVEVERRAGGVVFAPGPVVAVDLPGSATADALGAVQGWTVPSYEVTSSVVELDPEVLAAGTGPDVTDPLWTALPAGVPERVAALGRELAAGAATRVEAVERVERWLADNATYRLDSPVPGPGEDAVDRFLFVDRVGFCEQFAAAEVLLLRAAGIPARFVTGLGYGEDDGDRRTYRERDLHAWVEVFHPGHGWVPSDPTPPSTRLASAPWRTRVAAELAGLLRRAEAVPGGRPALAVGVLALTALTGLALRRRRPARSTTCVAVPVAGRPALAAFLRFDARLGDDRRRPQETLTELSARLALPDDLAAALRAVEAECYAPDPPDAAPAAALLDAARPT